MEVGLASVRTWALNHYSLLPLILKQKEAGRVLEMVPACESEDWAHLLVGLLINYLICGLGQMSHLASESPFFFSPSTYVMEIIPVLFTLLGLLR